MPEIYQRTIASDPNSTTWDFSSWKADAVVINLGDNDGLNGLWKGDVEKEYVSAYVQFVKDIKGKYDDVDKKTKFFLACGPCTVGYCRYVEEVVSSLTKDGVEAYYLGFGNILSKDRCSGHPSAEDQKERLAERTIQLVGEKMGWA